ncbi:MAG: aminotransferase class V-fold PLP-dependent enzyme, partial [Halobacteriovoraceae bacterium]|nr:aminotransferase class V-fold PLP-dependent enzyme [Halobacteriovoraceae bacterium]
MANFKEIISSEFAHLKTLYFNTAYFGPAPIRSKKRIEQSLSRQLDPSFYDYEEWRDIADDIRGKIAKLLNCPANNIAHGTSVSDFNNLIAQGYPFKGNDLVCAIDKEYPSNILPWMLAKERYLADFKLLNLNQAYPTVEWLDQCLPKNTKIFVVSHVSFETGKKIDIASIGEYLKKRNILFILDVTQALGGVEIKKSELDLIDVLLCSSYKWMLGPYGHAFAYFSPKAQEIIRYTNATWTKSPNSQRADSLLEYTTRTLPGARKYDRGQVSNMLTLSALDGSLDLFNQVG